MEGGDNESPLQAGRTKLNLGPGTCVEALFEDEENPANTAFYDGTVVKEHVGGSVYEVIYDDGDGDDKCPEWKLRPIDRVEFGYLSIGSDVRALWKKDKQYYDAKIVGENKGKKTYDIMFVEDMKTLKNVPCHDLRYASTLTSEEVIPNMLVMVQWAQHKFAPGMVLSKTNQSSKEEKDMTPLEKIRHIKFHVLNRDSEIKECPIYQLSRLYGFVPRPVLGARDDHCTTCLREDGLEETSSVCCEWCKCVWHLTCLKDKERTQAASTTKSGGKYYCPACTKGGKMKARRRIINPLQAPPGLLAALEEPGAGTGNGEQVAAVAEVPGSGAKRSAAHMSEDDASADGTGASEKKRGPGRPSKRGGLAASATKRGRSTPL